MIKSCLDSRPEQFCNRIGTEIETRGSSPDTRDLPGNRRPQASSGIQL